MVTRKEIDDLKLRLRYKHQKNALYDAMMALRDIVANCESSIDYCKAKGYEPSRTVVENLKVAKKGLWLIDDAKAKFQKEFVMERPAEDLGSFDTEDDDK